MHEQKILYGAIALSFVPFLYIFTDIYHGEEWLFVLANLTGFLAAVVLWWQFALGVRPVVRLFSADYAAILKLHIWLGTYGLIFVLLHGVLQMMEYGAGLAFLFVPAFGNEFYLHLSFGQMSFILLLVVWLTSAVLRGAVAYRPWKYVHYLSYPAGLMVYMHAMDIGTYLGSFVWLQMIWFAMAFSYVAMVVYRIADLALITAFPYSIAQRTAVTDAIMLYELTPRSARHPKPQIGQYVYLTMRRFGESHPFSVMAYNEETGGIRLGIKQFGPFTEKLAAQTAGTSVFVSQPFGSFTKEAQNSEPRVLVAGGIGVTPFVPLVKQYPENTYLFNCNTTLENAVARDELQSLLADRYSDVVAPDMLSPDHFKKLPAAVLEKGKFFICGPAGLMNATKEQLSSLGVSQERIFTEEFSF